MVAFHDREAPLSPGAFRPSSWAVAKRVTPCPSTTTLSPTKPHESLQNVPVPSTATLRRRKMCRPATFDHHSEPDRHPDPSQKVPQDCGLYG